MTKMEGVEPGHNFALRPQYIPLGGGYSNATNVTIVGATLNGTVGDNGY